MIYPSHQLKSTYSVKAASRCNLCSDGSHSHGSSAACPVLPWNLNQKTTMNHWLVVSTHLKNISQIGNLPQIGVKIENI